VIIISPNSEGHYGYYINLLESRFRKVEVLEYIELNKISSIESIVNEYVIVLNFWSFFKKKPLLYFYLLVRCKRLAQFIYNIDFLYKSSFKSFLIKGLCLGFKRIGKITLFTLVEQKLNNKFGLTHIPDPIVLPSNIDHNQSLKELFPNLDKLTNTFLLLFGSHDERKGTFEFLKHYNQSIDVLIVGKIHDKRILDFQNRKGVYILDSFVNDEVKHILFEQAICIVVPYINWFGSSGVLGTAISYEKVVLGSSSYFIGKVLSEYERAISGDISDIANFGIEEIERKRNLPSNSPVLLSKYFSESTFVKIIESWYVR
jgi:hypothetical protein